MSDQDIIARAAAFATQAHKGIDHRRKYSSQPYDVHLRAVAGIAASVTDDAEMIAAAWWKTRRRRLTTLNVSSVHA
jgi:(p)ppGpp synthase/HD superfamily hydrolase